MITEILGYAKGLGANGEVLEWAQTILAANVKKHGLVQSDAEHIVDYLISDAAPKRLRRMSYKAALESALAWSKSQQKKGKHITETDSDVETVHDFLDGTRIAKLLTETAYKREGFLMSHCLGGYNPKTTTIYSYRDNKNMPHATFEVTKNGKEITQIKGKGNGSIHPRYVHPILEFLRIIGMTIRPQDMKNLGYYHVPEDALPLVAQFTDAKGKAAPLVAISGQKYLYGGLVAA